MEEGPFVPFLCLTGLQFEFIDVLVESIDFVATRLLVLVRSNEGTSWSPTYPIALRDTWNLSFDWRPGLFRAQGEYFHLELKLSTLQFIAGD